LTVQEQRENSLTWEDRRNLDIN